MVGVRSLVVLLLLLTEREHQPTDWGGGRYMLGCIVRRTTDIGSPFVPGMCPGTPTVSGG